MFLKTLAIENWGPFKGRHTISLEEGIYLIQAQYVNNPKESNNAGKSCLLEAIPYLLFGETREKSKDLDLIHKGTDFLEVSGILDIDGKELTITRRRTIDNKASLDIPPFKGTNSQKQEELLKVIGRKYSDFVQTYQFRQGNFFNFMEEGPSDRIKLLINWLDLGKYAIYEAKAKAIATTLFQQIAGLDTIISLKTSDVTALSFKIKEESSISLRIEGIKAQMASINKNINELKNELRNIPDYSTANAKAQEITTTLKECFNEISNLHISLVNAQKSKEQAEGNQATLKALEEKVIDYPVILNKSWELHTTLVSLHQESLNTCKQVDEKTNVLNKVCSFTGICPIDNKDCDKGTRIPDQKVTIENEIADLQRIIESKNQLQKTLFKEHEQLQANLKTMEQFQVLIKKFAKDANPDVYNTTIDSINTALNTLVEKQEGLVKQYQGLNTLINDSKAFQDKSLELQQEIKGWEGLLFIEEVKLTEEQRALGVVLDAKTRLVTTEALIADKQTELKLIKQRYYRMLYIAQMFGKDGIPSILVENSLFYIEELGNIILESISRGSMQFRIDTNKEVSTKETHCSICGSIFGAEKVCGSCKLGFKRNKIKDEINITVINAEQEVPFAMVSDGMGKIAVSLALRLSLAKLLNKGSRIEFLLVDEVFAGLDSVNREQVASMLFNNLMNILGIKQIFCVSHCELNESNYKKINIIREKNWSKIA